MKLIAHVINAHPINDACYTYKSTVFVLKWDLFFQFIYFCMEKNSNKVSDVTFWKKKEKKSIVNKSWQSSSCSNGKTGHHLYLTFTVSFFREINSHFIGNWKHNQPVWRPRGSLSFNQVPTTTPSSVFQQQEEENLLLDLDFEARLYHLE
jgi:hypothetical protein